MDTSPIEELQALKSFSPIWASSSISRKQQATGFEPLRHKYLELQSFICCFDMNANSQSMKVIH